MSGPFERIANLIPAFREAGHETALCASHDANYRFVEVTREYPAPVARPLGLPAGLTAGLGRAAVRLAPSLLSPWRRVRGLDDVLSLTGTTSHPFFERDLEAVRHAIRTFRADVVYADARPSAIAAARLQGIPAVTGYSATALRPGRPGQVSGINRAFAAAGLEPVNSLAEVLAWAQLKIVASSPDLQPVAGPDVVFTGPLGPRPAGAAGGVPWADRRLIVGYVGSGVLSAARLRRLLTVAVGPRPWEVQVADLSGGQSPVPAWGGAPAGRLDFERLLPRALVFVNHGGQNSVMDGLRHGVPQVFCPGMVEHRRHNARIIAREGAGVVIEDGRVDAEHLADAINYLMFDESAHRRAAALGRDLVRLGGVDTVVAAVEELVEG